MFEHNPNRPHRKRYEHQNHARFLTCSCFQGRPFLGSNRARKWWVTAMNNTIARHQFELWAWVLMPEHFHILIFPEPRGSTVSHILKSLKLGVSVPAVAWVRENAPERLATMADPRRDGSVIHRFWQPGGGYDRNLWTPRHIWETIDYIHQNPVTRGLCASPENWEWSSARWYRDRTPEHAVRMCTNRMPSRPT